MQELHISVRNLVEFIFRAGDIDNRAGKLASAEAMMEGSRIHRKIQKSMDTSYQAEVPLKIEWKANDYVLVVEGRADGIAYGKFQPDLPVATESVLQPEMEFAAEIPPEEEISFIDEIKGVKNNTEEEAKKPRRKKEPIERFTTEQLIQEKGIPELMIKGRLLYLKDKVSIVGSTHFYYL